jgi:hypothetical protein
MVLEKRISMKLLPTLADHDQPQASFFLGFTFRQGIKPLAHQSRLIVDFCRRDLRKRGT